MNLDDLGRAAWDAEWRAVLAPFGKDREPPPYTDINRPASRAGALAAMERFAEEVASMDCGLCGAGNPIIRDRNGALWHSRGRVCTATYIHRLLSSLRDEAGQKKGSE